MGINVYFISGLSANCHVFDQLELPEGFEKKYIEWKIPRIDESMDEYARSMAEEIDTAKPYILVGYSFGGILIQEMNKFLHPLKNIMIASIKNKDEVPPLLRFGRKIKFAERFPFWSLTDNKKAQEMLAYFVYRIRDIKMTDYVSYTDPVYMQWSVSKILNWDSDIDCPNLYHIHGTRDVTFPHKYIKNAYLVEGGDHFMVFKRANKISRILTEILLDEFLSK